MKIKVGDKFGEWTVIGKGTRQSYYLCRCSCGKEKEVWVSSLTGGKSLSCGHIGILKQLEKTDLDIINHKFGRLTPIKRVSDKKALYLCKCDCGNLVERTSQQLKFNNSTSCGCFKSDNSKDLMKKIQKQGQEVLKNAQVEGTNLFSLKQGLSKNNTSGVKGVCKTKKGKYRAYITLRRKQISLGVYSTLEEAAKARARAEEEYYEPILQDEENQLL